MKIDSIWCNTAKSAANLPSIYPSSIIVWEVWHPGRYPQSRAHASGGFKPGALSSEQNHQQLKWQHITQMLKKNHLCSCEYQRFRVKLSVFLQSIRLLMFPGWVQSSVQKSEPANWVKLWHHRWAWAWFAVNPLQSDQICCCNMQRATKKRIPEHGEPKDPNSLRWETSFDLFPYPTMTMTKSSKFQPLRM